MNLSSAPIKDIMLNSTGLLNQVWIQFFSSLGTGLKGEWDSSEYKLEIISVPNPPNPPTTLDMADRTVLAKKGSTIELSMSFENGRDFSPGNGFYFSIEIASFSTQNVNKKNAQFEETFLNVYDKSSRALIAGALVSGDKIFLPKLHITESFNISGTLILKTDKNIGGV